MSEEEIIESVKYQILLEYQGFCNIDKVSLQGLLDLYNKEKEENETLKQLLQGYLYEMYKYYKEKCKNLSEENTKLKILIERQKIDDNNK